jgi:hypothetical protein
MKRLWQCIYLLLTAAAFFAGTGVFGKSFGQTNVDWVFVSLSFLICTAFPKMAISYARNRQPNPLPSPSLSRGFVGGWWTDPGQCLLLTTLMLCGSFLGSLLSLPRADQQGIMLIWWQGAMAIGLVIGSFFARTSFRGSAT